MFRSSRSRRAVVVTGAGLALAATTVWYPSTQTHLLFTPLTTATLVGIVLVMLLFIGVGLTLSVRHPGSVVGGSLTGFGFVGMLYGLTFTPQTIVVARWVPTLAAPLLARAFLASPTGALSTRDKVVFRVSAAMAVVLAAAGIMTDDPRPASCQPACPRPVGLVVDRPDLATVFEVVAAIGVIALMLVVGVRIVMRWRSGSAAARKALEPVMWSLVPLGLLALSPVPVILGEAARARFELESTLVLMPALVLVAGGFLVGEMRSRSTFGVVSDLARELEQGGRVGSLERVMQARLNDPTLALGFWLPNEGSFVGVDGRPFEPDQSTAGSAVTEVIVDGDPVALVSHDLAVDAEIVSMVGSAAALAFQNERLHAEVRARLEEVRESRARLVAAADDARRRVERDVHDGAQQRLVSLGMVLGLIEDRVGEDMDDTTRELLTEARNEASVAVEELRDLTHGLYPALLADAGLDAAVRRLADGAPFVVTLDLPSERLPSDVEGCAYFVIAESLTNAIKHAKAKSASITAQLDGESLHVVFADDGVGGVSPAKGSGLRGLEDRVGALGGEMTVNGPAGEGTIVEAWIPCA